jgi:3,4-dihydroxy 2-butanone 4-phosphate synthase / GTP cyclohydrolase II
MVRVVTKPADPIERAIRAIARGEIVIVVDDVERENEGDLIMAAQFADAERLAFFVRHTSGFICAAVTETRADELELPLMVQRNTEVQRTAFTVTVDARQGTTTGISAGDRARTIQALVDPATQPEDLARPGHLHVLRARAGGVLERPGHTEAGVDLARLAGLEPVAVLSELVSPDGLEMARGADLRQFAAQHDLVLITIAELVQHRRRGEQLVRATGHARLPTEWGEFRCHTYESVFAGETHLAFVMGDPTGAENVLVRLQRECITGDVFESVRCRCRAQLRQAMTRIAAERSGVVVYLRGDEGLGLGMSHRLRASEVRDYGVAAKILADLEVASIRLMTDNPAQRGAIEGYGLAVAEQLALESIPNRLNAAYEGVGTAAAAI